MKRLLILGTTLALTGLLMFSCNKHRFDLDPDNLSVVGSGQWKLPIGTMHTTIKSVLDQMGENNYISYDSEGNLQVSYQFAMNDLIVGSSFLNLGTMNSNFTTRFANPFPGMPIEPIDTVFKFKQQLNLTGDSTSIETAVIKTGRLTMRLITNLANISEVVFSSPDLIMPDGDTLTVVTSDSDLEIDLAGATFNKHDPFTGEADSTFVLHYAIHYQMTGIVDPEYEVTSIICVQNVKLKQLSGYFDSFVYDIAYDSSFKLPMDNLEGQLNLVGARVRIQEKNTFGGLSAKLYVNRAELYGGELPPSLVFDHYPYVLDVNESPTYSNIMSQDLNIGLNTKYNAFRFEASLDLNPNEGEYLVHVYDTSTLGMKFNALVPMRFNIPGVYYLDTMDLNMSEISAVEYINEILLTMLIDSEMPFNLDAQFYTLDSQTGRITDSLMVNPIHIGGSFAGKPVHTDAQISVTKERLNHLVQADKLVMRFGIDTDNHDELLNLDDGLTVTLKADVLYGGEIDINQ